MTIAKPSFKVGRSYRDTKTGLTWRVVSTRSGVLGRPIVAVCEDERVELFSFYGRSRDLEWSIE